MRVDYADGGVYVLHLRQRPRNHIVWLQSALASAKQLNDKSAEGRHLGNLGLAYAALGEVRKAIEHYEQALLISKEIGDRRGEGSDLGNLGNAYANLGDTNKATELMEAALKIFEEIESPNANIVRQWLAKLRGE